ncbi:MAG: beta-lactamase family protein [Chitinophagales bacterium]|nr:beta-lactamase family protein [Chitinophagales bacterium]
MNHISILIILCFALIGCHKAENTHTTTTPITKMYFPSNSDTTWERTAPSQLEWNTSAMDALKSYLEQKNTKSFMILVNGRIVMEDYFDGHTASTPWEWNSAGKTLISATVGIAQQKGLLQINDKVSDYLGKGWTSMSIEKEDQVTIRHLLTMTSGMDDTKQLIIKANLTYVADAGTRWAYSNVFQRLTNSVAEASNTNFETFFNENLKYKIGMDGRWNFGTIFTIFHSTTRSMARFGLLALNEGKWDNEQILNPDYFRASTASSQTINPSYGYLWWLNGKEKYMVPGSQTVFPGTLIPNAPADMYAAMGANDQRIYVIPSKKMVIVRMGNAANPSNSSFALSGFDNELWAKINAVIR